MGQKVNPLGFRIGIRENWRSRWFANKKDFSRYLYEDQQIRKYLKNYKFQVGKFSHENASSTINGHTIIPCIEIERTREKVKVYLYTAKPGIIIGKKGGTVDYLHEDMKKLIDKHAPDNQKRVIEIEIKEVTKPDVNAQLVAENLAEQIIKRANVRRAMKKAIDLATTAKALGIKISIGGRLSGAEMARTEKAVWGKVPLQTLDAHIQYGFAEAFTTYGAIGIKVWIYLGKYGQEAVTDGISTQKA